MNATARSAWRVAAGVVDPELQVVTVGELGILRGVEVDPANGAVTVTITPTYAGCPAMDAIRTDIAEALREAGHPDVRVTSVLAPAWTTDWITPQGRRKLAVAGIAPPGPVPLGGTRAVTVAIGRFTVECPLCGSGDTEELSRFGSTACKALWRCRACAEPFDRFKAL